MPRRLAERVLLLGWSGVDWPLLQPLLDAGRMPHLEQLVGEGTMGNLATLPPIVSRMLWASIATGKRADRHGVHGPLEIRPDGAGTRPVASTSLRARPLWQIVGAQGLETAVVGWEATHPAAAGGIVVTDHFRHAQGANASEWPMPPDSVAPPAMRDTIRRLRLHPADLDAEQVTHFAPGARPGDARRALLGTLLAETATVHAAGTWLAEHRATDLLAVQYSALDVVCREFARYRAPAATDVSAEDTQTYGAVIDRFCEFYDLMLGRYMRLAGPEATIVVVSEHGLTTRWQPGVAVGSVTAETAFTHRPYGIVAVRGPAIAHDHLVFGATVLDVAPTVLTMLGLPVGRDMEGRVLHHMFGERVEPSYVPSHDPPDLEGPRELDDPDAVEAAIRHLERLGYTRPAAGAVDREMDRVRVEQTFNLAEVHFDRGRWPEALALFASVLERRPDHAMAQFRLVQCRLRVGDVEGGRALAGDLLSHDIDSPWAQLALGLIDAFEKRWDDALRRFQRAQDGAPTLRGARYRTGAVRLRQKRWDEAEAAFRESLEQDGETPEAYHGLGLALHAQRRHAEAAETLMRSIGLVYDQPLVHFHLGAALYAAGYVEAAVQSLETALEFRPDLGEAHGVLARILRGKGDLLRSARHEAASATLRNDPPGVP